MRTRIRPIWKIAEHINSYMRRNHVGDQVCLELLKRMQNLDGIESEFQREQMHELITLFLTKARRINSSGLFPLKRELAGHL